MSSLLIAATEPTVRRTMPPAASSSTWSMNFPGGQPNLTVRATATSTGQWTDLGPIPMNTYCDFKPSDQHLYQIVAVDPAWCSDPTNYACVIFYTQQPIEGDPSGPALLLNIL